MALELKHLTRAQFLARLRERYRDGSPEQVGRLSVFITNRITRGDLTDTEMRAVFGKSAGAWSVIKTRMQTVSDQVDALKRAAGE